MCWMGIISLMSRRLPPARLRGNLGRPKGTKQLTVLWGGPDGFLDRFPELRQRAG